MTIYDRAAATALRLLAKYGRSAILRVVTTGEYDPEIGSAPQTTTDHDIKCATFDYELRMSGTTFVPGTLIQAGDKQIFIAASGLAVKPAPGMTVVTTTDTWTVMAKKEVNPAGTPVLYEVLGRA